MAEEREAEGTGRERPSTAADRRGRRSAPVPNADRDGRGDAGRTGGKGRATAVRDGRPARVTLASRLVRFLREVVAELRKVIWPTRKQLVTYTLVVLVFVSFMVALVAGLDYLFAKAVLFLFGT